MICKLLIKISIKHVDCPLVYPMWCKESDKVLKNMVLLHHMIELISCALQKPVSLYKGLLGIRFLSEKDARNTLAFCHLDQQQIVWKPSLMKFLKSITIVLNGLFDKKKNEGGFQLHSILTANQVNLYTLNDPQLWANCGWHLADCYNQILSHNLKN